MPEMSYTEGVATVLDEFELSESETERLEETLKQYTAALYNVYDSNGVEGVVELLKREKIREMPPVEAFIKGMYLGMLTHEKMEEKVKEFFERK